MYAKLCQLEILSSYLKQISVGDLLTVEALITNPLDWHHFYEKISIIKKGERTDFTVVTSEGDRLAGSGNIVEVDKWSNYGHYGFKIKINIEKQKSLTEKRIREEAGAAKSNNNRVKQNAEKIQQSTPKLGYPRQDALEPIPATAAATVAVTPKDMANFSEMLKNSVALDMA